MKSLKSTLILLLFCFFLQACGGKNQAHPIKSPQATHDPNASSSIRVIRDIPSVLPAFYQFPGLIGNAPQRVFNPSYEPRSRSKTRPHLTRESAGALLYTVQNNKKYVLIGKERQNRFWNFMRGSVDVGDSYIRGAANEIHQETGSVYQVTEEVLLSESFDVYFSNQARNYACTFFVKLDYVPAQDILDAAINHPDHHFREMTRYEWIRLEDLNTALGNNTPRFAADTMTGKTHTFSFYPYSFDILKQAYKKNILTNLN